MKKNVKSILITLGVMLLMICSFSSCSEKLEVKDKVEVSVDSVATIDTLQVSNELGADVHLKSPYSKVAESVIMESSANVMNEVLESYSYLPSHKLELTSKNKSKEKDKYILVTSEPIKTNNLTKEATSYPDIVDTPLKVSYLDIEPKQMEVEEAMHTNIDTYETTPLRGWTNHNSYIDNYRCNMVNKSDGYRHESHDNS